MKQALNKRAAICLVALLVIMILTCNTNNHPDHFLIRIFPPYEQGNSKFFYANLIVIMLIPFILFGLYKGTHWTFINSVPKRLLWTVIFLILCTKVSEISVQVYKSLQNDLDAIYLDREQMGIEYSYHTIEEDGKKYHICDGAAYITLKNCSNKTTQAFKIEPILKATDGKETDTIINTAIKTDEVFSLEPGETRRIPINFSGVKEEIDENEVGESGTSRGSIQEVVIYNDTQSVHFVEGTL